MNKYLKEIGNIYIVYYDVPVEINYSTWTKVKYISNIFDNEEDAIEYCKNNDDDYYYEEYSLKRIQKEVK